MGSYLIPDAKLQFLDSAGKKAGIRIPLFVVRNIPLIRVVLPEVGATYFQFDTGFSSDSGSLHTEHVRALEERGQLASIGTTERSDVNGTHKSRTLRLTSLKLADFEHRDLIFTEHSGNTPSSLGLGYCNRFTITFDLGNSAIYLKPSKNFARRDRFAHVKSASRFGLVVARQNEKPVIAVTKRGGPAEKAGVYPSDVLLAVNGTDVSGLRLYPILSLFAAGGDSVRLTIERDGECREILVNLPPPLVVAGSEEPNSLALESSHAARGDSSSSETPLKPSTESRRLADVPDASCANDGKLQPQNGDARVIQEFDIANDGDALLVPVTVGGGVHLFCIDTGCTGTVYDESFRAILGKRVRSTSVDSMSTRFSTELFDPPSARLGRLDLHPEVRAGKGAVACIDLNVCRGALGYDIRGIIGKEFLKNHVVRFDFDRGKLEFRTAPGDDAGVRLPFLVVKNTPLIRVELPGGVPTYFQIDTGFVGDSGSLHEEHVRYLEKKGQLSSLGDIEMRDPTGKRATRTLRLTSLKIGDFEHHDLIFHEHSRNTPSILGLGYCIRYIMTLDLGNSAIYLKPSKGFARREKAAHLNGCFRFGLAVAKHDGKAVVSFIMPGGPADNAGLLLSDVVLGVNGTEVSALRRFSILSLLTEAGSSVRLTVDRGGAHRDILVSLPPPLVVAAPPKAESGARENSPKGVVGNHGANGATNLRSTPARPALPAGGARYRLGGQRPLKAKNR